MDYVSESSGLHATPRPQLTIQRVHSIDVFRGLTIYIMLFVNDVSGVKGLPAWMKHMPDGADGMTFVDVVFPAFLFIVGLAVPFAFARRISRGESNASIMRHI